MAVVDVVAPEAPLYRRASAPGRRMTGARSRGMIWKRGGRFRSEAGSAIQSCRIRVRPSASTASLWMIPARRHPDHVPGLHRALVPIEQAALENERHRLKPGMGMGAADGAANRDVQAVVHQEDEGIAGRERCRTHDLHGRVALADESGLGRGGRVDA